MIKDSTLLGTFSLPPSNVSRTIANINMITSSTVPFDDTWIVPLESELDLFEVTMPLSPFELAYQAV